MVEFASVIMPSVRSHGPRPQRVEALRRPASGTEVMERVHLVSVRSGETCVRRAEIELAYLPSERSTGPSVRRAEMKHFNLPSVHSEGLL